MIDRKFQSIVIKVIKVICADDIDYDIIEMYHCNLSF